MATLALSVVGAGLGQITGIGASTGWMLGSTLGRLISADTGGSSGGLSELKVTGASYGSPIPRLFGTLRLGGNVIWMGKVKRAAGSNSGGGKGGMGTSSSGASDSQYEASFAVAFAEGEMDGLLKIWADGELIYNAETTGARQIPGLMFRFYRGDEVQGPDSILQGELGVDDVPGYRGICYVVFDNLPLSPYGNRLPNIEVLVTRQAERHYPGAAGDVVDYTASQILLESKSQNVFAYSAGGGAQIHKIDAGTLNSISVADFPTLPHAYKGFCLGADGTVWAGSGFGMLAGRQIHRFHGTLMEGGSADLPSGVGAVSASTPVLDPLTGAAYQVAGSQQSAQVVVFDQTLAVAIVLAVSSHSCSGALTDTLRQAWVAMGADDTVHKFDDLQIIRVKMMSRPGDAGAVPFADTEIFTIEEAELTPGNPAEVHNVTELIHYNAASNELVFQNNYRLLIWSIDSGQVRQSVDGDFEDYEYIGDGRSGDHLVFLKAGRWVLYYAADTLVQTDVVDLLAFEDVLSVGAALYDWQNDSVICLKNGAPVRRLFLRRMTGQAADYSEIITSLCTDAGLSALDIDVSAIDQQCGGYVLPRQMSVQDGLDPLLLAGRLNVVESGYKLKFLPTTSAEVIEISAVDLLTPAKNNRVQESELPGSTSVSYMASDGGYQIGTQNAKRSHAPHPTSFAKNSESLTLPMALSATEAKEISFASLQGAWQERHLQSLRLPIKYLALDAADQIRLVQEQGMAVEGRISETYLARDLSMDAETVGLARIEAGIAPTADAGHGYVELPIRNPDQSDLILLDLPLLRDEDATAGSGSRAYMGCAVYNPANWSGAEIYRSALGARYDLLQSTPQNLNWGVAGSTLPAVEQPFQTDLDNHLIVQFAHEPDELESVSELEMLCGQNVMLVGEEIIQFASVELQEDGRYKLSTLLRGRRGTEYTVATHQVGEKVILLEAERLSRMLLPLSMLGNSYYYKAVSYGRYLEDAQTIRHAHRGRDLMPFAPVQIKALRASGLMELSWQRRSRIGAADLASVVPLSEMSERYELVVKYGGVQVSKYIIEERQYTYEIADFNTDFDVSLIDIPILEIELYQLSEAVGRGFPAKETL